MQVDPASLSISVGALLVSATTLWLTLVRRGAVKMTQPTTIYFGPDPSTKAKIYLRALLFATARKGRVVENMYLTLERHNSHFNFPVWVFGESKIRRGSGLAVTDAGVAADHHFLLLKDGTSFTFVEGEYRLRVFAKLLKKEQPTLLLNQCLTLTASLSNAMQQEKTGVYFDWVPVKNQYVAHAEAYDPVFTPSEAVDLLRVVRDKLGH